MVYEETMEDVAPEVEADRSHAQIFFKITDSLKSDAEAAKIVRNLDVHVIEKSSLSTHWVLLKLEVKDMRSVALKLTEQGFVTNRINALV